jgi:hypothetical protein
MKSKQRPIRFYGWATCLASRILGGNAAAYRPGMLAVRRKAPRES